MRWAILAAGVAIGAMLAGPSFAEPQQNRPARTQAAVDQGPAPSPLLIVTSPPNAAADRTYESADDALREADIDWLVREARRNVESGDTNAMWYAAAFADYLAANRLREARGALERAPGGLNGPLADMLEPFLIAAEGNVDRAVERVDSGGDNLPAPLPEVARALLFESAGRLPEAAAVYALMVEGMDVTPPGEAEPQTPQEFDRALNATRVTHAVYRAALVHHRLGRSEEARRYYAIVSEFAPRSIDVEVNLERLAAGQPPVEAPLDITRATGRWMLFMAEFLGQAETLTAILAQEDPRAGFASTSGAALLQMGVLLAQDADDWRLSAAHQVLAAGGADGAERIVSRMTAGSIFAPDAEIARASIELERGNDAAATQAADRALNAGADRWAIVASVGDVYRRAGQADRAIPAFDRALTMVEDPEDRADILGWRAYAHRFAGNLSAASADMRAAYELDQSLDTRLLYVSILMDDPNGWADGVRMARSLFAEQPDSVLRLNALGYALIQRPEGLEEGYRLLWRGFNFGQTDAAVVDSLGWAYYLYGRFDEARVLIERANELSVNDPNAEILDHLGDVYWRLDRRDDARRVWREAIAARPDAIRRRQVEQKLERGLTTPAPRRRDLPQVTLPDAPSQREET